MRTVEITIKGETTEDLLEALEQVSLMIEQGYKKGYNKNECSGYRFEEVNI